MTTELVTVTPRALERLAANIGTTPKQGDGDLRIGDDAESREIRAMIRANPGGALALLADREHSQLSLWQSALLLDEVVGQVPNIDECRTLINDHVGEGTQEELLAIRSDLPASAAYVVDKERLVGALLRDIGAGEDNIPARCLVFLTWSMKLLDRPDWSEILTMEIDGLSVQDLILLGIATEHTRFEEGDDVEEALEDITPDVYETHGLNPNEGEERLRELLEGGSALSDVDVEYARKALGEARTAAASDEVNNLADAAKRAAEAAASGDDL